MHMRIPHWWSSTPAEAQVERPIVCIVDSNQTDYECWGELANEAGVQLEFLPRAADALRMARNRHVALWVINTALADLRGADLCAMLKSRQPQTAVYLVADDYSVDQELAAATARATLFGCKPAHRTWLAHWLAHRTGTATPIDSAKKVAVKNSV